MRRPRDPWRGAEGDQGSGGQLSQVANETIRALQAALAATTMETDGNPNHNIM